MTQNPPTPSEQTLLEEYRMLRTDLHQRINFRFQVFNLLLVALGAVFGREHAVHVVVAPGKLAAALRMECGRLAGLRGQDSGWTDKNDSPPGDGAKAGDATADDNGRTSA